MSQRLSTSGVTRPAGPPLANGVASRQGSPPPRTGDDVGDTGRPRSGGASSFVEADSCAAQRLGVAVSPPRGNAVRAMLPGGPMPAPITQHLSPNTHVFARTE